MMYSLSVCRKPAQPANKTTHALSTHVPLECTLLRFSLSGTSTRQVSTMRAPTAQGTVPTTLG